MKAQTEIEVLLAPAELAELKRRRFRESACVVFDVLRATSTMVTALANGAWAIIPVDDVPEAVAVRQAHPEALLAGERNGLRITVARGGIVDFDLGNSPLEFTPEAVAGHLIVMSTTNGTRALRACAGAGAVLVASFLNLGAVAGWILRKKPARLIIVCAGTGEHAAFEDAIAAGALCNLVWPLYASGLVADSALVARQLHDRWRGSLVEALGFGRNGRRLLSSPELCDDVAACAVINRFNLVAALDNDGAIRRTSTPPGSDSGLA